MNAPLKLSFIDLTIICSYILFVGLLLLGLSGYFHRPLVILTLIGTAAAVWFLRKRISVEIEKKYFWFFVPVAVVAAGFALARGFFAGDSYETWLAVAWETTVSGGIPAFFREIYYAGMPLPSLLFAATFSLSGLHNEFLALWVPLFFTAATLWILWGWGREHGLEQKYLYLLLSLFLASQAIAQFSWSLLQEPPVLFFSTAAFYYLDRLLRQYHSVDLLLFTAGITLAGASKLSGLFLLLLVPYAFFKLPEHRKLFVYSLALFTPLLVWLARNYLLFGDPVMPVLVSFLSGPYHEVWNAYQNFRAADIHYLTFFDRMKFIFPRLLSVFPFLLLSVYGLLKSKKWFYLALTGIFLLLKEYFLFTPTQSATRYYYFLFGLLLVYAVIGLSKLQSKTARMLLLLLATAGLLYTPVTDSSSVFISSWEDTLHLIKSLALLVLNYKYLLLMLLLPVYAKLVRDKEDPDKKLLVLLYGLYIVQLYFVANKTWLATWPFILLTLLFAAALAIKKPPRRMLPWTLGLLAVVTLSVSWGIGAVYARRQKTFRFPADFVYALSRQARETLDRQTSPTERKNYSILITAQPDYFNWLTDYQAINLPDFGFFKLLPEYRTDMNSRQLQAALQRNKIKYIVRNSEDYEFSRTASQNLQIFLEKIKPDQFSLIGKGEKWEVWQVY